MSIVFGPDAFTVGANVGIVAYNGTSYVYVEGTTTAATVNATNDRVQQTTTSADIAVRICDPAVPTTGNGTVSMLCSSAASADDNADPAVRMKTDNTLNYYMALMDRWGGTVKLYRRDPTGFALLTGPSRTLGASHTVTLNAVTNGANVDLTATINGLTNVTFSDGNAARKLDGTPGFHMYATNANVAWIDDLSVDDTASTTPITVNNLPTDSLAGGEIV